MPPKCCYEEHQLQERPRMEDLQEKREKNSSKQDYSANTVKLTLNCLWEVAVIFKWRAGGTS